MSLIEKELIMSHSPAVPFQVRPGALAISVHGRGKWRLGNVKVAGYQGLGTGRREVLLRKTGQHRILGLSGARCSFPLLLCGPD